MHKELTTDSPRKEEQFINVANIKDKIWHRTKKRQKMIENQNAEWGDAQGHDTHRTEPIKFELDNEEPIEKA
jgi:hypothetical protein